MLNAIAVLLLCQLAGEIVSQFFALPVPGPVLGMVTLLLVLQLIPATRSAVSDTANGILRHLSLLFVPAGVGVMLHAATVMDEWLAIVASLLLGTVTTLIVTAFAIKLVMRALAASRGERP